MFTSKKFEPDFPCILILAEAVFWKHSVKKVLLKISKNPQENRVSFLTNLRPAALLNKRIEHRCFPVNFEKFLGTCFLIEHLC